ncbi:MAG TPA: DUF4476 domain-containing protein, partial [Flavobacteriales bacterium]|nr:DUF4476 domain-containing protein [Flavobacteriales bacterium]
MKHFSTLALAVFFSAPVVQAQTSDLVFFTDDGSKFTLIIDGDVKNATPETRVVATGIRTESPMVMIKFEDPSIPQLRKSGMFPLGMEYTIMITMNKKGERVLRPTGQAALGTAAASEPVKPKPTTFQEDPPASTPASTTTTTQTMNVGGVDQVTSTTVVEETPDGMGSGENMNISMGVNGVGLNMNVAVNDGTMGTTGTTTTSHTTTTTTTTHTTTSGSAATMTPPAPAAPAPVREPDVYHMPGYTGPVGCGWPMSESEFAEAKKSIESKGFEETKMTTAKQVGRDRCFTVEQVKGIMSVFGFEDTKLEFAKYAYDRTYDIGNYYRVNDAF